MTSISIKFVAFVVLQELLEKNKNGFYSAVEWAQECSRYIRTNDLVYPKDITSKLIKINYSSIEEIALDHGYVIAKDYLDGKSIAGYKIATQEDSEALTKQINIKRKKALGYVENQNSMLEVAFESKIIDKKEVKPLQLSEN